MLELELLEAICRGIDPRTGETLDTPREPGLDKKRVVYLAALRRLKHQLSRARQNQALTEGEVNPINIGMRWREVDDQVLRTSWLSGAKPRLKVMADTFGRTKGAIAARLVKIGIYSTLEEAHAEDTARQVD